MVQSFTNYHHSRLQLKSSLITGTFKVWGLHLIELSGHGILLDFGFFSGYFYGLDVLAYVLASVLASVLA